MKKIICFMKSLLSGFIIILTLSIICISVSSETNIYNNTVTAHEITDDYIQTLFETENIEHYAYMDLASAEETLKPIILEARNQIIFQKSWVADGVYGCVKDPNGNIVEVVPQFSELFPADWEPPVLPIQPVDESYYAVQ